MNAKAARIALAVLMLGAAGAAQNVSIEKDGSAYRVTGWRADPSPPANGWSSVFAVYAGVGHVPPLLGAYSVEKGALIFKPRFPASGVRVRAVFQPPGRPPLEVVFEPIHKELKPSTRVEHVYPSIDALPSNQLKFYVHFSAPMSNGEAWQHLRLLDSEGSAVDLPFLEIDQELWDRDYRRLTILFDPGRIKRGVLPLEQVGAAIEEGKQYTLVVSRDWKDSRGAPLTAEFRKSFRVGPAERRPIDPTEWRIDLPKAGTSDPLVIDLKRPMDSALLARLLEVPGVEGSVSLHRNESEWRFVPASPWKAGDHELLIDNSLEDLAGNKVGRAFDVDVFETVTKRVERKTTVLPIRIRQQ